MIDSFAVMMDIEEVMSVISANKTGGIWKNMITKNMKEGTFFFFLVCQMVSPLFTTKVTVRCRSSRLL